MVIEVTEACARTGYCVRVAPGLFTLDDDPDRATVRSDAATDCSDEVRESALDAEATCPLGAILVHETDAPEG